MNVHLLHLLIHAHHQKPWAIDVNGKPVGCATCVRERIMRAIKRQPRPPVGKAW